MKITEIDYFFNKFPTQSDRNLLDDFANKFSKIQSTKLTRIDHPVNGRVYQYAIMIDPITIDLKQFYYQCYNFSETLVIILDYVEYIGFEFGADEKDYDLIFSEFQGLASSPIVENDFGDNHVYIAKSKDNTGLN